MNFSECLPPHRTLSIDHNDHTCCYIPVQDYFKSHDMTAHWISPEQEQLAYETQELWEMRWSDDQHNDHYVIGQSLDAILLHVTGKVLDPIQWPAHKASMLLEHNNHLDRLTYELGDLTHTMTLAEYAEHELHDDFVNEVEKQKFLETGSLWLLLWYPRTPIGSYRTYASSMEAILEDLAKNHSHLM